MASILILLIISAQFALAYYAIRALIRLEHKIIELNSLITEITPKICPGFQNTRKVLKKINKVADSYFKNTNKLKLLRNLFLLKSLTVAFILYKKRKNIFEFFSLYNIVNRFVKALLEF